MQEHLNNGNKYLLIDTPEGANRFKVFNDDVPYLSYFIGTDTPRIYLPFGKYELLGLASQLSESEAGEVVESFYDKLDDPEVELKYFKDYSGDTPFATAKESLASLLQSLSLSPNTIILKAI